MQMEMASEEVTVEEPKILDKGSWSLPASHSPGLEQGLSKHRQIEHKG